MKFKILFVLALSTILTKNFISGQEQTQIVYTFQKDINSLEEKLKSDLNEKFSKLSAQLNENDRRVKTTLSIFESEWIDKSKRLSDLEERHQQVELSVIKLTKLVNEFIYGSENINSNPSNIVQVVEAKPNDSLTSKNFSEIGDENVPKSYVLFGTRNNFKILNLIPPEEQSELSSIELTYVELSPQVLINSLQNCSKLKSLKLIQVRILGEFESRQSRVHLPQLSEFLLDQVGVLQFLNHTIFSKWSEVDDYLRGFDEDSLNSLIFFYKDDINWKIENISKLKVNIDVIVDGVKLFGINHIHGELNSMLKFSHDLVRYLREDFHLLKLAVSAWRLDLAALPETLTHLNFNYIHYRKDLNVKTNLTETFGKLKYLQEFNTFIGNQGGLSGQGLSWSSLPNTLQNLTIRFSDVNYNSNSSIKLSLDNLYFHYCKFDRGIAENFHMLFDSTNVGVSFRIDYGTIRLEHELLRNILKTNVTWIFMQNFNRTPPHGKDLSVYWTIETFLLDSGISQFVQHFILQKRNGSWEGWNVSKDGQILLTFQLVGTNQFVTFGTYKKIIG